jgi:hypothetical protein
MWAQWVNDTSGLLTGLPALLAGPHGGCLHPATNGSGAGEGSPPAPAAAAQQLLITLERWLTLLKIVRRLLVFGHVSDHKSLKPVQEMQTCVPAMLQASDAN